MTQGRRVWLKRVALGALACVPLRGLLAQQGQGRGVASLSEQLTKGLRAVTPDQQQFVQVVVLNVDQGNLPR
ncbi:MAG: hypothetical protein R3C53_28220, partial [Pirellulaceae bacterium]